MLSAMCDVILDEKSSSARLRRALEDFAKLCSEITGIAPDPSFNGWAEDSFLDDGVAINPGAAAHCVKDYQRSVVFLRGVNAALNMGRRRFAGTPLEILYAGCGPYATLLLPLLERLAPGESTITLLDIHQRSLDSVSRLIDWFGLGDHKPQLVQADACHYQHARPLHLVVTEALQKSLEQEPQFAVTANLAPQLHPQGLFIPGQIEVELCLADQAAEREMFLYSGRVDAESLSQSGRRCSLGTVLTLQPRDAAAQLGRARANAVSARMELPPTTVVVPAVGNLDCLEPLLFTRILVFDRFNLRDYEAEITLPRPCPEMQPLRAGSQYRVSYALGKYPKFELLNLAPG